MEQTQNKKVVVIEDDVMLSSILMRHLADEHIEARLISSGDNAMASLKEEVPQVVVLDIFLPGINGLDLLDMMRKDDITKDIKVLIVSNSDEQSHREIAVKLKASFLVKATVTPTFIIAEIKKMLAT